MEGYGDPFCRRGYPWGGEDKDLLGFYTSLGKIRRENPVYRDGEYQTFALSGSVYGFSRGNGEEKIYTLINLSDRAYKLEGNCVSLFSGEEVSEVAPQMYELFVRKAKDSKVSRHKFTGTCSAYADIEMFDDLTVKSIVFSGGCKGNLAGINALAVGQPAEVTAGKLLGITCGSKPTSCPDQLAKALIAEIKKRG
jgi:uncharacterized protein (TIGR03905 family)